MKSINDKISFYIMLDDKVFQHDYVKNYIPFLTYSCYNLNIALNYKKILLNFFFNLNHCDNMDITFYDDV